MYKLYGQNTTILSQSGTKVIQLHVSALGIDYLQVVHNFTISNNINNMQSLTPS